MVSEKGGDPSSTEAIGKIISTHIQHKQFPTVSFMASLGLTLIIIAALRFHYIATSAVLISYWTIYLLYQAHSWRRKKIFIFGTEGCICSTRRGKSNTDKVYMYKDIPNPKFDITDYKINGIHTTYLISVYFGEILFIYNYDPGSIPADNFNYICSHELYKLWNKHMTGASKDYDEENKIAIGSMHKALENLSH